MRHMFTSLLTMHIHHCAWPRAALDTHMPTFTEPGRAPSKQGSEHAQCLFIPLFMPLSKAHRARYHNEQAFPTRSAEQRSVTGMPRHGAGHVIEIH